MTRIALLVLLAGIPSVAMAQSSDPALPPVLEAGPPPLDDRPMRFLLSTGAVVIGTRIGETSNAIGVRTRTGIATIQKNDLVTMDYQVQAGRSFDLQHHVRVARPAPPLPLPMPMHPEPRRHPGRAAKIGGGIVLGLSYTIALFGAAAAIDAGDSVGGLLAIPVVGPGLWGLGGGGDRTTAIVLTVGEVLGAALLAVGFIGDQEAETERAHRRFALAPMLTPETQGVVVAGSM